MGASDDSWEHTINALQSGKQSFAFVDLGISKKDWEALQNLQISETTEYGRYTRLHLIPEELAEFLRTEVGSKNSSLNRLAARIIHEIAEKVVKASGKETAWVCVRASTPSDEYDLSRWHTDGSFYKPYGSAQLKFAGVLRGASTIFVDLIDKKDEFHEIEGRKDLFDREKRVMFRDLIPSESIVHPNFGQGAFFLVGSNQAAIHSEPAFAESRLFFSVVPGTQAEIEELANSRKESL